MSLACNSYGMTWWICCSDEVNDGWAECQVYDFEHPAPRDDDGSVIYGQCHTTINPRANCYWCPAGGGCDLTGTTIKLQVTDGYCWWSSDTDTYCCCSTCGETDEIDGTAGC